MMIGSKSLFGIHLHYSVASLFFDFYGSCLDIISSATMLRIEPIRSFRFFILFREKELGTPVHLLNSPLTLLCIALLLIEAAASFLHVCRKRKYYSLLR
mmetsp:Transcript_7041/g.16450  ORF Transcript_7041/g.16450 Transcript_7041/m.16450 type:complete len:99 (-) Transcript_7041:68-364(-)